jgi:hypothetical protein
MVATTTTVKRFHNLVETLTFAIAGAFLAVAVWMFVEAERAVQDAEDARATANSLRTTTNAVAAAVQNGNAVYLTSKQHVDSVVPTRPRMASNGVQTWVVDDSGGTGMKIIFSDFINPNQSVQDFSYFQNMRSPSFNIIPPSSDSTRAPLQMTVIVGQETFTSAAAGNPSIDWFKWTLAFVSSLLDGVTDARQVTTVMTPPIDGSGHVAEEYFKSPYGVPFMKNLLSLGDRELPAYESATEKDANP